jgi:hypothetical protein
MKPLGILLLACVCAPAQKQIDPDEGTLSSTRLGIPEPMVFDLIRPLGAKRGEVEVNSLFRMAPGKRPRTLQWAPEIEYTVWDGYGIEFEVPLENNAIDTWKGALQGTLKPPPFQRFFTHGWQVFVEAGRAEPKSKANLLYLAGSRFHPQWSVFTMNGVERERDGRTAMAFVGNYTVFYHARDKRTYGVETNFKGEGVTGRYRLLMPQLHWRGNRVNVQAGCGYRWLGPQRGVQVAMRVSREF